MTEAELRRRDPDGNLVDWSVNADGTEPTADEVARERLLAILDRLNATLTVADDYTAGEVLPDQIGADAVLTFTFASPCLLIWVRADGADVRADPFGGTPSETAGIRCEDGIPNPLTVTVTTVRVWAPAAATVSVWGFRR